MKTIFTIARKEFLDTIRDRRTLIIMVVIPLLLFPGIMYVITTVQAGQAQKAQEKDLNVGIINPYDQGKQLLAMLSQESGLSLIDGIEDSSATELVRSDSLDIVLNLGPDFDQQLDSFATANLQMYFQSTDDNATQRRVEKPISRYEDQLLAQRLSQLSLSDDNINPIEIQKQDVATQQEFLGNIVGGFLPYIFIIFSFMGCVYPAIDLFAGEKERGTLETILTTPAGSRQILFGKMIVVASSGIISAGLAILGLFLSINLIDAIPADFLTVINDLLRWEAVALLLALIIPMAIFFAGMLIPLATYARSFKEAQSTVTPLNFLVIIPAAIGLTPGIELNIGTALIPILNVALASKEIVAGTVEALPLILVFVSLIALAAITIFISAMRFSHESNVLRS